MQTVNSVFKGMNNAVISLKNLHNERLHLVNISWYIFGVTECLNEYEKVGHVKRAKDRRKAHKGSHANLKERDHWENQLRWEDIIKVKVI